LRIGVKVLARSVFVFDNSDMQGIVLCKHFPQRFIEAALIDSTQNLNALGKIVAGIVSIKHLNEPNAELCLGQREILYARINARDALVLLHSCFEPTPAHLS
jgi:hypothetical protein